MSNDNLLKYWDYTRRVRDSGEHIKGLPIHKAGSDVAVVFDENAIVIDGSDTAQEWASNLMFLRFGMKGTHSGFALAAHRFWEEFKHMAVDGKTFIFPCYSRGAGIAQILALKFAEAGCYCNIVSFGSPKVGGKRFREEMAKMCISHVRVEMEGDPVAKLPMWWKHYDTDHVLIANNEKGVACHTKYGEYL